MLELYADLREERTAWVQRIDAVLFHHGVPALGEDPLGTAAGGRRCSGRRAHLSPAGQLQVATALDSSPGWRRAWTRCAVSCWRRPGT